MKAAVFHGPRDIRIEEIDYPSPGNKGTVMKVHACGICPLKEDIIKVVMDETDGYGADIALEMSCRPESLQEAVSVVKPFSQIWLGTFYTAGPFYNPSYQARGPVSMNITQKPGLSINTAWGTLGPRKPRLRKAIEFLTSGKISSAEVITHVFPLDNVVEAFETASDFQKSIRVMLAP